MELRFSKVSLDQTYHARLGDIAVEITAIDSDNLTFLVPVNAVSGLVTLEIEETEDSFTYPSPLTIIKPIPVLLDDRGMGDVAGYEMDTVFGVEVPSEGPALAHIDTGEPTIIIAAREATEPLLMAVATPTQDQIVIDAHSTATALLFTTGPIYSLVPGIADARLEDIEMAEETLELAQLIEDATAAGRDYLDEPDFEVALETALLAAWTRISTEGNSPQLQGQAHVASGNSDQTSDFRLVHDLPGLGSPAPPDLINPKALGFQNFGSRRFLGLDFEPKETESLFGIRVNGNPLDWIAHVYRLDPSQFSGGFDDVGELSDDFVTAYQRSRSHPDSFDVIVVPSKTAFDKWDILDLAGSWLVGKASEVELNVLAPNLAESVKAKGLHIPFPEPGVYMVRAFSGAYWEPQFPLLKNLPDGNRQWAAALALNLTRSILDLGGIVLDITKALDEQELKALLVKLATETSKHIQMMRQSGDLEPSDILELSKDLAKQFANKALKDLLDFKKKKGIPLGKIARLSKFLVRQADILAKIGNVGKFATRTLALSNWPTDDNIMLAQAVESTILVVGDPWAPVIQSMEPTSAHRGHLVTLVGKNFSPVPENNIVDFEPPLGTDPNPQPAVPAVVVSANPTTLAFIVPEEAKDGDLRISLTVRGTGSIQPTIDASFHVIPDPSIEAVDPDPVVVNQLVRITGRNFPTSRDSEILVQFGQAIPVPPIGVTEDSLLVYGPSTQATNSTVEISIADPRVTQLEPRPSNRIPIDIELGRGQPGSTISVTTTEDGDPEVSDPNDREVTLREAMGWMSGWLSRPPNVYERQHFFPDPDAPVFGPGFADSIALDLDEAPNFKLNPSLGPLPALTDYDTLYSVRLDGNGQNGPGLVVQPLPGHEIAKFVTIHEVDVHDFLGDGISFNNSMGCRVDSCRIYSIGHVGVAIRGQSRANSIDGSVGGSGADGVLLDGSGVQFNTLSMASGSNMRYGVHLREGASYNRVVAGLSPIGWNKLGGILVEGGNSTHNTIGIYDSRSTETTNVSNNDGPGIEIQASHTTLINLTIHNNQGEGILVTGDDISNVAIRNVRVGGALNNQEDRGLQLHGIRYSGNVHHSYIGSLLSPGGLYYKSTLGGNAAHGIWLEGEGVHHIRIDGSAIGYMYGELENGQNGIYLSGGTHANTIGSPIQNKGLQIYGHSHGSGILIEGENTKSNVVTGVLIYPGNQYGIRLANGAHQNIIGRPGAYERVLDAEGEKITDVFPGNAIYGSTVAGIKLASGSPFPEGGGNGTGGGTTTGVVMGAAPEGEHDPMTEYGNVIQNNYIGDDPSSRIRGSTIRINGKPPGNRVGIEIVAEGKGNLIGGRQAHEPNIILKSLEAGILIKDSHLDSAAEANRIWGNWVGRTVNSTDLVEDPLDGPPLAAGIGLLIENSASHIVGGIGPGEGNVFSNAGVGVYIDGSEKILVLGNQIGDEQRQSANLALEDWGINVIAGLLLRDCEACVVAGNSVMNNGNLLWDYDKRQFFDYGQLGGIRIHQGSANRVQGNRIGSSFDEQLVLGNAPHGIAVTEATDTIIGGPGLSGVNVIVGSQESGIFDNGADTLISGNLVGVHSDGSSGSNQGSGIVVEGAHAVVGGRLPVLRNHLLNWVLGINEVAYNEGHGIQLSESSRDDVSVAILNTSIHHNADLGIDLFRGGNEFIAPPEITSIDLNSGIIRGRAGFTTDEFARVPVGDDAVVQLFMDAEDEGQFYIGEASVGEDFQFTADLLFLPIGNPSVENVTAIVTADNRWSSEFGYPVVDPLPNPILKISRLHEELENHEVPLGTLKVAVHPIVVSAPERSIRILRLGVSASGSLVPSRSISALRLYMDKDRNEEVSKGDVLISGPGQFAEGSRDLSFDLTEQVIEGGEEEYWIVAADFSMAAGEGTLTLEIGGEENVTAEPDLSPGEPVVHASMFPVTSDHYTIAGQGPISAYSAWAEDSEVFPEDVPESERDLTADPDGDAIQNFGEFYFKLNPMEKDSSPYSMTMNENGNAFIMEFFTRKAEENVSRRIQSTSDLNHWSEVAGLVEEVVGETEEYQQRRLTFEIGDGTEQQFYRLEFTLNLTL